LGIFLPLPLCAQAVQFILLILIAVAIENPHNPAKSADNIFLIGILLIFLQKAVFNGNFSGKLL
jgi:hypothetical protein